MKNLCLPMIGLFLSLNFVRPFRSGPWISRSLWTEVCKSVLMSAASVRAQQSYWMRWCGHGYLGDLILLPFAFIFVLFLQIPCSCNP